MKVMWKLVGLAKYEPKHSIYSFFTFVSCRLNWETHHMEKYRENDCIIRWEIVEHGDPKVYTYKEEKHVCM
jgi:hypothetical protein